MLKVNWVVKIVILLESSAFCFCNNLYFPHFGERILQSSAYHSNLWFVVWSLTIQSLVGSNLGLRLGSLAESLICCCNLVKWLIQTWFWATKLRLVNPCTWLAKRKIVKGTKNFAIAFIFQFIASIDAHKYFKMLSVLLVLLSKELGLINCENAWLCARHWAMQMQRKRASIPKVGLVISSLDD